MSLSVAQVVWSVLGCGVGAAGLWLAVRGAWRRRTGREKPCAKCGYDLANSAVNEGFVLCAECGTKLSAAKVIARRRRRWWLVWAGVVLLLLAEPVWRMQHVVRDDGSRNWMALVPTWVLAVLWPVPAPVMLSDWDDESGAWREAAKMGRTEFDARTNRQTTSNLVTMGSDIFGSIYARRLASLWDGASVSLKPFGSDEVPLRIEVLDPIFSIARPDGQRWSDEVIAFSHARFPGNERDTTLASRLVAMWQRDVVELLAGGIVEGRWGNEYRLSVFSSAALHTIGKTTLYFSILQDFDRLETGLRSLDEFYVVAGAEHNEQLILSDDIGEVRAYWVGDICERRTSASTTRGLPALQFVPTVNEWLRERKLNIEIPRDATVDPTGEILVLRGDAATHQLVRDFLEVARKRPE